VEPWFADAKPINSLEPEIAFHLWDAFNAAPYQRPEPLALPEFQRAERLRVRTSEAIGHEAELAAYYGQVAALARQHALKLHQVRQYFWMDLRLDNEEADVHLSFPWYDTFSSMDHFLVAVAGLGLSACGGDDLRGPVPWIRNGRGAADRLKVRARECGTGCGIRRAGSRPSRSAVTPGSNGRIRPRRKVS